MDAVFINWQCYFFIGAFLGDIIETLFCRLSAGIWMSRSSVVWDHLVLYGAWDLLGQLHFYIR